MVLLVNLLAIAMVVEGCILIFKPELLRKFFDLAKEGANIYLASGIKIVAGIVLIISANASRVPWIVLLYGSLMLFSGVLAFVIKKNLIIGLLDWIEKQPPRFVYYAGGIAILLGVVLSLAA
jgi:uncharacterized membrane protein HdeD (DUF308 family)